MSLTDSRKHWKIEGIQYLKQLQNIARQHRDYECILLIKLEV